MALALYQPQPYYCLPFLSLVKRRNRTDLSRMAKDNGSWPLSQISCSAYFCLIFSNCAFGQSCAQMPTHRKTARALHIFTLCCPDSILMAFQEVFIPIPIRTLLLLLPQHNIERSCSGTGNVCIHARTVIDSCTY